MTTVRPRNQPVSMPSPSVAAVRTHYDRADVLGRILDHLRLDADAGAVGAPGPPLDPDRLAPVSEFHLGGRWATRALAEAAGFGSGDLVLDVGSGVGGPSRYLAAVNGCRVVGVDLAPGYGRAAFALGRMCGIGDRLFYLAGDAGFLPLRDRAVDGVWLQHVSMNLPETDRLFVELARVARRGATLAVHEVVAGPDGAEGLRYPLPWAATPETSFLDQPAALVGAIAGAGFAIDRAEDVTGATLAWLADVRARGAEAVETPSALEVVVGPDWPTRARNVVRGVRDGQLQLLRVIARRM